MNFEWFLYIIEGAAPLIYYLKGECSMFIYKISNTVNDKVYIGQTIRPIEERFHRHINDAMNNILDTHFARAIRLYGPDKFYIELLDTANTQEELTQKEHDYIQLFNSVEDGYNETDAMSKCGGNTYKSKTEEEMNAIKEKIRQTKLGGKNPHAAKVKCKNVETDKELFFDSMAECATYFGKDNHQFISRRCRGDIKSLYEGKWKFAYQDQDYDNFTSRPNAKRTKRVEVLNLETQEKVIFNTMKDADRYCGFGLDYTSKKFKSTGLKEIYRNQYKLTLLD